MKAMSLITAISISLLSLFSCKKDANNTNNTSPTNLSVTANVSTDSSGNVAFVASATNATSYDYDYGDGTFQTVVSGTITYKYATSGTYTVNVIATNAASGLTISKSIQVTVKVVASVFWSEEFNTDGAPNPSKWGYDLGAGGWGNNELEYYTARPENAVVQGGVLKIKLIKESYNSSNYTSARLISKNKFAFTYGRVDIMAKLPAGGGTWPALWMLGSDVSTNTWPACGEIDIMEHKGNDLNKIFGTLHYPGHSGGNGNGANTTIANATTQFHKYSLDWSSAAIKIYVDDVLFHTVANSSAIPFNHDFFFILNVAMGGDFGGAVDPNFAGATMEVDYIRVYK